MKKKGFTLIELLAVIVVLAIIALIATPMIMNVIDKAKKGALEDSAYGLIDSASIYYTKNMMDGSIEKTTFTFEDGKQTSEQMLEYKGNVEEGSVMLFSDGKSAVCIRSGKHTAVKNVDDDTVHMTTGACEFNEVTQKYETMSADQEKIKELEAKVEELTTYGDATANDIKEGKTALVQGEKVTGVYTGADFDLQYSVHSGGYQSGWTNTVPVNLADYPNAKGYVFGSLRADVKRTVTITDVKGNTNTSTLTSGSVITNTYYDASDNAYEVVLTFVDSYNYTISNLPPDATVSLYSQCSEGSSAKYGMINVFLF